MKKTHLGRAVLVAPGSISPLLFNYLGRILVPVSFVHRIRWSGGVLLPPRVRVDDGGDRGGDDQALEVWAGRGKGGCQSKFGLQKDRYVVDGMSFLDICFTAAKHRQHEIGET